MTLALGATAPDFKAETTQGTIHFYEWMGDNWCVLFSHPKDFTPVCTTEIGSMARLKPEFDARNVKVIGLSVDSIAAHTRWIEDIVATQDIAPNFPLIGDPELKLAKLYGMLPEDALGSSDDRSAADNATTRSVFVISPDKKIMLTVTYPMTTGRDFRELLRAIDSLQLTAQHKVATPANWKQGDDVVIVPSMSDADARARFPKGWEAPRPYMRIVPQPR